MSVEEIQLDFARTDRIGFGEAVFCINKTPTQINLILDQTRSKGASILLTRLGQDKYEELKKYVDEVYCLSVNDSFVMNAWFRDQKISKVKPIGDGEGKFTKGMDMLVNKPKQGFGLRSWRYSMIIDNEIITYLAEEPGINNFSNDEDPYVESTPEKLIAYLELQKQE